MIERDPVHQAKMLLAIQNWECYWSRTVSIGSRDYIPLNQLRAKFGLSSTTPEEIAQQVITIREQRKT